MNWQLLKQRSTQFGDNKHAPGRSREFWASVRQNRELLTYLVDKKEPTLYRGYGMQRDEHGVVIAHSADDPNFKDCTGTACASSHRKPNDPTVKP